MHHAGVSWQRIALQLEQLADARAKSSVVYEITFDTGEIIRFDGLDWLYAPTKTAIERGEDGPSDGGLGPSPRSA